MMTRVTEIYNELKTIPTALKINHAIENTYRKLSRLNNRILFLNKCKEHRIIPNHISNNVNYTNYLHISDIFKNKIETVFKKTFFTILNLEIKYSYRSLDSIFDTLDKYWKEIKNIVNENLYNELINLHKKDYYKFYLKNKQKTINRFLNMVKESNQLTSEKEYIINLSDVNIPEDILNILSLGPKFSINNEKNQNQTIINLLSDVEYILNRNFKKEQSQKKKKIRNNISNIVTNFLYRDKNSRPSRNNIGKLIQKTKKFKKEHEEEIIFIESDKSNKSVALNKSEYTSKMLDLLQNEKSYKHLSKNPLSKLERKLNLFVNKLEANKEIEKAFAKHLKSNYKSLPQIYGLIKLHKPQPYPLRPVVSSIDSPLENLSQWFTNILKPLIRHDWRVKNSYEAVDKIKNITLNEGEIFVSFDIVNLYPSLPRDIIKNIITKNWNKIKEITTLNEEYFMEGIQLLLDNNFFEFQGAFYEQISGLPAGSKISPVLSDLVLDDIYENIITKQNYKMYYQYVDDSICALKENNTVNFLESLNSYHPNIVFTIEKESNNEINFLDILIKRVDGSIKTDLFIKPSKSTRMINFKSEQPINQKLNIIKNEIFRIKNICHSDYINQNLEEFVKRCQKNGYPKQLVLKQIRNFDIKLERKQSQKNTTITNPPSVFYGSITYIPELTERINKELNKEKIKFGIKSEKALRPLFSNKSKIKILDKKQLVYKIECKKCQKDKNPYIYIGETKRPLKVRLKEHFNTVKNKQPKTALAIHCIDLNHEMDYENTKIVCYEKIEEKRKFKEAAHVQILRNSSINFKSDTENLSENYTGIISRLYNL